MATETSLENLVINQMTKAQYEALSSIEPNQLYLIDEEPTDIQSDWSETDVSSPTYIQNKPSIPTKATAVPLMDGTAAIGDSANYAAADHIHPTDTSRAAVTDLDHYLPLSGGTINGEILHNGLEKNEFYRGYTNQNGDILKIYHETWDKLALGENAGKLPVFINDEIRYIEFFNRPEDNLIKFKEVDDKFSDFIRIIVSTDGEFVDGEANLEQWAINGSNNITSLGLSRADRYVWGIASSSHIGGVRVGENLTIDENGILNATEQDLSEYATKEFVSSNYLDLSGGEITGDIVHKLIVGGDPGVEVFYKVFSTSRGDGLLIDYDTFYSLPSGNGATTISVLVNGVETQLTKSGASTIEWQDSGKKTLIQYRNDTINLDNSQINGTRRLHQESDTSEIIGGTEAEEITVPYIYGNASTDHVGGVKVGSNLTVDADGTLNATVPSLAGYATETYVNTQVSNHATNSTIHVTSAEKSTWNSKQDALIAGDNINIASDNTISVTAVSTASDLVSSSNSAKVPTAGAVVSYVTEQIADLEGALQFIGVVPGYSSDNTDEQNIAQFLSDNSHSAKTGDVVIMGGNCKEYIYVNVSGATPGWREIGDEGMYVHKSQSIAGILLDHNISIAELTNAIVTPSAGIIIESGGTIGVDFSNCLEKYNPNGGGAISWSPGGTLDIGSADLYVGGYSFAAAISEISELQCGVTTLSSQLALVETNLATAQNDISNLSGTLSTIEGNVSALSQSLNLTEQHINSVETNLSNYLPLSGGTLTGDLNITSANLTVTGAVTIGTRFEGEDPGTYSFEQGSDNDALGYASHAEGEGTHAYGDYSHTEGNGSTANGEGSHAEGFGTYIDGNYSHAEGVGTSIPAGDDYVYAWNGDSENTYQSHGEGTFNINPKDGLSGFYIGDQDVNSMLLAFLANYLRLSGGTMTGDINRAVEKSVVTITNTKFTGTTFTIDGDVWDNLWRGSDISPVKMTLNGVEQTWSSTDASSQTNGITWTSNDISGDEIIIKYYNGSSIGYNREAWIINGQQDASRGDWDENKSTTTVNVPYIYGPATTSQLGGVKIGTGLTIESDGTLNGSAVTIRTWED